MKKYLALLPPVLLLNSCFSTSAIEVDNICRLLDEKVSWYQAIRASEKKYQTPAHVQLAIIYQESRFSSNAQPPRGKLFGVVPWKRPSSAYGYAQAVDNTWRWYKNSTGNLNADRNDFKDSADFVGWYMSQSKKHSGIKKSDAYNQYLAYHEGHGGFNKKSYRAKPWLMKVAKTVSANAKRYQQQLKQCTPALERNRVWRFF